MTRLKDFISILRPQQWYKNLIVFMALIYSGNMFHISYLNDTIIGFVCLCLVSSSGYIINDLLDIRYDRQHLEKSKRPIASGRIGRPAALVCAGVLLVLGMLFAFNLDPRFAVLAGLLFLLTLAYSAFIKNTLFLDILLIAVNFVIRAVSGAYIISVYVSPWLVMCPFFLSLFLSAGKRMAESNISAGFRPVLKLYTREITSTMMIITTTLLIMVYSLYTIEVNARLMLTLPVVLYGVFLYFYLAHTNEKAARYPHLLLKNPRMVAALFLWLAMTVVIVYWRPLF